MACDIAHMRNNHRSVSGQSGSSMSSPGVAAPCGTNGTARAARSALPPSAPSAAQASDCCPAGPRSCPRIESTGPATTALGAWLVPHVGNRPVHPDRASLLRSSRTAWGSAPPAIATSTTNTLLLYASAECLSRHKTPRPPEFHRVALPGQASRGHRVHE
jgi:hypothetical protein